MPETLEYEETRNAYLPVSPVNSKDIYLQGLHMSSIGQVQDRLERIVRHDSTRSVERNAKARLFFTSKYVWLNWNEYETAASQQLTDQLIDVFRECSQPNWDGEDADAVEQQTLDMVRKLVESLPARYRTPSISGEPDGHVSLEWYENPRRILTVSVNPNGTLHWAALIGTEDPRGSCPFDGKAPKTLLYWIERVCQDV